MVKESQGKRFCSCIKKVRKSFKNPRGSREFSSSKTKTSQALSFAKSESAAIGICVKSVLQTKGKTLRRFTCGKKPKVITQKMKNN